VSSTAIDRLAAIAKELGASPLVGEVEAFRARMTAGRFYLACVGEFKRGKSTLLNALIGEPLLPAGVVPVTAVPTIIHYGPSRHLVLRFRDGRCETRPLANLQGFLSEAHNPDNSLDIAVAEVSLPHRLLRDGLSLVDTPGVGSVFAGSAKATRDFVPQIDAAIAVIGSDPPLSGEEAALIRTVGQTVRELIVVLNKADRSPESERREATRFAQEVVQRTLGGEPPRILEVSAAERLAGTGAPRDWPILVDWVKRLAPTAGPRLADDALRRGVGRLARQCNQVLDETYAALWRPIEASEQRMMQLRTRESQIADRWLRLAFRMEEEEKRLVREASQRATTFLKEVVPRALGELRSWLNDRRDIPSLDTNGPVFVRELADRTLGPWIQPEFEWTGRQYDAYLERWVEQAERDLEPVEELRSEGVLVELDRDLGNAVRVGGPVRTEPSPPDPPPSGGLWLARLIPGLAQRTISARLQAWLEQEIARGARQPQRDLDRRLGLTRQRLVGRVHEHLQGVFDSLAQAIHRARTIRDQGEAARSREVARLARLRKDIATLREA
jgi:hypothetical protein